MVIVSCRPLGSAQKIYLDIKLYYVNILIVKMKPPVETISA